jgi:hypothetical protein
VLRHGDTRGAPCVRCASEVLAHGGDQRRGRDVCGYWHVRVLSGLQGLVSKIVKLTGRNLRHILWMCGPKNYNSPTTQSRVATTSGRTPKAARDCYWRTQVVLLCCVVAIYGLLSIAPIFYDQGKKNGICK